MPGLLFSFLPSPRGILLTSQSWWIIAKQTRWVWAAIYCEMRGRRTLRSLLLRVGWNGKCQGWENAYNVISLRLHVQVPEIVKAGYETQLEIPGNKIKCGSFALTRLFYSFPPHFTIFPKGLQPFRKWLKMLAELLAPFQICISGQQYAYLYDLFCR